MTKKITFLFFCFGISALSFAQEFKSGLVLGANATQVDGDDLAGYHSLRPLIGIYIKRDLSERFLVQAEFNYSGKGAKRPQDENSIGNVTQIRRLTFNYVDIPFLVGYKYNQLTFYSGLSLSYLFHAEQDDHIQVRKVTNDLKRFESMGYLLGSYVIADRWSVMGGFGYSLTCISQGLCQPLWSNPRTRVGYRNNLITASLRYSLN
jgi:hypothetical protein